MSYQIQTISFMADGLVVQYIDPETDVRVKGAVVRQIQVTLNASHPDYRDDIESLHSKAVRVLTNALDDFEESEPHRPSEPDEDETALGMGGSHE